MYVCYKKYDVHFIFQFQQVIECVIQKSLLYSLGHKIYKTKRWLTGHTSQFFTNKQGRLCSI